jgi:hypothetical protein
VRARDNPFAVQRAGALAYRLAGFDRAALLARFRDLGCRAALVGPPGHGKTTLLDELTCRLAAEGWRPRRVVLRQGERRLTAGDQALLFAGVGATDLLVVDGAQELSALAWRQLRRASVAAGGLLVTSHHEGLLPTLHLCATTPELLAELMAELAPDLEGLPTAGELFARHRGDLRAALFEAYDLCARL